ncbi:hypothetical protein RHSIM_Rhsim02G0141400 [Rhododendron simsii]|uniref:Uncharacterized protein n=1 Tax=Rhododendron simsii TaxID=118357 RepID=A0A834LXI6_RHOSS|nr:hypothetical protein RHSIM_Rhsim02G0141400 [Rhododendron simsii]
MQHCVWLDDEYDRARQLYLSYYCSIPKSLEQSIAHKLLLAMLNGDERFVEPMPESLENLTLESVRDAVMNQFVTYNMEVFWATRDLKMAHEFSPITYRPCPSDLLFQQHVCLIGKLLLVRFSWRTLKRELVHFIAGPAPNRWGFNSEGIDLFESARNKSADYDEQPKSEEPPLEIKDAQKKLQRRFQSFTIL